MGFRLHHPQFFQWHEAERSARDAEQKLYSKLCDGEMPDPITQEELDSVRALRRAATLLMGQMLSDMRETAESLKSDRTRRRPREN